MAGPGPIPISEVLAYCGLMGMTEPEERAHLLRVLQRIDRDFLEGLKKRTASG